jgi:hypothetical protein
MKATYQDFLDGIVRELRRVQAGARDESLALDLRNIERQLEFLPQWVEGEGEVVWNDIADQRLLLAAVQQQTAHLAAAVWAELAEAIGRELDRVWHTPAHYPRLATLHAENDRLQSLIDRVAATLAQSPEPLGERRTVRLGKALHDYLVRKVKRQNQLLGDPDAGRS